MNQCPTCKGSNVHRSRIRTRWKRWRQQITGTRPYRCPDCGWRGWAPDVGPKFEETAIEQAVAAMAPEAPNLKDLDKPPEPLTTRGPHQLQ